MDEIATRNVIEAALLAAGKPLSLDKLLALFERKGVEVERADVRLREDYEARGIELKEVASGYRVQVKSSERDWLEPLFEERAPRYTRALLETLALIAYRQPITRAEIEEVRGVAVSTNIIRTLLERGWVRVVGYRDVPGKPSMLGTTKEFLDYFGLKRLEDLPPLSELRDLSPSTNPQSDLLDTLQQQASDDDEAPQIVVAVGAATELRANAHDAPGEMAVGADGPRETEPLPGEPQPSEPQGDEPLTAESEADEPEAAEPEIVPVHKLESG
jgi:segregation and condensation protein B